MPVASPTAPRRTLLEWFLGSIAAEVPPSRLATALSSRPEESWSDWLLRAAGVLGWQADSVDASPQAVGGERDAWWVTCDPDDRERWLILAGTRSEETRASVIDGLTARDVSNEPDALSEELRLDNPQEEVRWIRLTPALPLESLRSPGTEGKLSPLRRLGRWTNLERRTVLAVVAYSTIIGLISLALPLAVQSLVNLLAFGRVLQPLLVISAALLIVLSLAAGLRVLEVYIVELLQRRQFTDLSQDLARRLPAAREGAGGRWGLTERINRFFDIVGVQKSSSSLLLGATEIVMSTVAGLTVLAFYHPYLLVFDLVLIVSLALVLFRLGVGGIHTAVRESEAKYELAAWLESVARQERRFVTPEGAAWSIRQTDRLAVDWLGRRSSHFRIVLRQTIGFAAIQALASAALLGLGSFLVWNGQLSLGQLVAAELIITGVVAQLAKFGKHVETFYDLNASVDKLGMLIDLDTENSAGELPPEPDRPISVAAVALPVGDQQVTFRVSPGERVGLTGLAYHAAVELFQVLYARREARGSGRVELDGVQLDALAPRAVRQELALVREPMPVGATLEENLTAQDAQSTPEEIRALLRRVGLGRLIAELPDGLETWIHPDGEPLTPDQRIALEVARAVRTRPRLMLVDGILDRVGREARGPLLDVLMDRDAGWSLLVASQDPEVLARCDRTVHLGADAPPPASHGSRGEEPA
jgi:ABC-type bacteriocin/lantibiotic exporter with double-glycine peptidase domain